MDRRAVERLQSVNDFDSLLTYLRDELDWPVEDYGFDDLTFQYTAQELGLDDKSAAKVTAIRRLRPLDDEQPWGIFFLELEPKRLPVVALRRLLSKMTLKKRASSNRSDSPAWHADDILFISRTGESDERHLTFAHFAANPEKADLPVLKVLGWDASDTVLRVDHVAEVLKEKLVWPEDPGDSDQWRRQWRDAFTLKHREQVTTAKEMASRLAELARGIRGAIREVLAVESENGPLTKIMDAFRESLVHDLDPEQFADTYAQTITYGLLSARITDPSKNTLDDLSSHMQTNPFLKELMESFIHVGGRKKNDSGAGLDFDELGVSDVIDLLDNANVEAVVRDFGKQNQQEDPVIHFFEGFLQEYDKSIRKDRGVFYTPRPVVSFIVRSVDELLRTEFGLEDGLADTTTWGEMAGRIDDLKIPEGATADQAFVQILDPATGTGTFLVEVIDLIHKTMTEKWQAESHGKKKIDKLWNGYVPKHLLPRLHGYELMMAPYAIAHMKIGLKLHETGYRFESDERARVYLTNALEPAQDFSGTLAFAIPALAHEAEAVNAIKRDQRFTVVIGNPPYSAASANPSKTSSGALTYAGDLIQRYFSFGGASLGERNPRWLQDDYVKFFALSERLLGSTRSGILGFISNHGYLINPTFRGMRESLMDSFDLMLFMDLHGSTKRSEVQTDGSHDENVFDIQTGVAVAVLASKSASGNHQTTVKRADIYGSRKRKYEILTQPSEVTWSTLAELDPDLAFKATDSAVSREFQSGIGLDEIFDQQSVGIVTSRDALTIHFDRNEASEAFIEFFELSEAEARDRFSLGKDSRDWKVALAQGDLQDVELIPAEMAPILYRPFDRRYTVYTGRSRGILCRPRRETMQHMLSGTNVALISARSNKSPTADHFFVSRHLVEAKCGESTTQCCVFPLRRELRGSGLFASGAESTSFVAPAVRDRLHAVLGRPWSDVATSANSKEITPEILLAYIYSQLHSPSYRVRYGEHMQRGYPRILLPQSPSLFDALSELGQRLISLHLLEVSELRHSASPRGGPTPFQVEKVSYSDETVWIDKAKTRGFKGVPEEVWNFHIGGYQVCNKWLKDRQAKGGKNPRPGRVLSDEDIEHYQKIVVALSETIRIMAEIDEVIEAHGGWPNAFQTGDAGAEPVSDVVYAEAGEGDTQLDMVAEPKDG